MSESKKDDETDETPEVIAHGADGEEGPVVSPCDGNSGGGCVIN